MMNTPDTPDTPETNDINLQGDIEASAQIEGVSMDQKQDNLFEAQKQTPADREEPKTERGSRPDFWPEDLWDQEKGSPKMQETIEKMNKFEKMAEDMRKRLSTKDTHKIPEAYTYEGLPEDITKNPQIVEAFSSAAKEAGLSNEQANTLFNKYFEEASARDSEISQKLMNDELAKLGSDQEYILGTIQTFTDVRVKNGTFSQEEADALKESINSAAGARALVKAIELTGETRIPGSVRSNSTSSSIDDIKQSMVEAYKIKDRNLREKELVELRQKISKFE